MYYIFNTLNKNVGTQIATQNATTTTAVKKKIPRSRNIIPHYTIRTNFNIYEYIVNETDSTK